jgi:hypothetical protein
MAQEAKNRKHEKSFSKAYDFLLKRTDLTSAEKLTLIVVCRYWPNPYWDSNLAIAKNLGFCERYAEKVIKTLADKGIIKRGYAHTTKNGRPHTVRVVVPQCLPEKCQFKINWVRPEHMDGQQTEHTDGNCPNNGSFLPEQSADLLDKNRKEKKKATPASLPAGGQAPALLEDRKKDAQAEVEPFERRFGSSQQRKSKLSPAEFEQRRQTLTKALLGDKKS